ncbi:HPF/RaiA family ribosome-associated protein [Methylobacterium oxalidis]|uniref:HPF/RaiA family ribosome-associated protein n=1 Tax=Methylobacterium oxalidis TaxID=944322 RepID=UPI00331480B0
MLENAARSILVQSSNVDLGDVLPQYARASILQTVRKYFGRLEFSTVHFNREGPLYKCTVTIQVGTLKTMSGEAQLKDAYDAFRSALEKVAKQLRRAKRELREDKATRIDKDIALTERPLLRRKAASSFRQPVHAVTHLVEVARESTPVELGQDSPYRIAAE